MRHADGVRSTLIATCFRSHDFRAIPIPNHFRPATLDPPRQAHRPIGVDLALMTPRFDLKRVISRSHITFAVSSQRLGLSLAERDPRRWRFAPSRGRGGHIRYATVTRPPRERRSADRYARRECGCVVGKKMRGRAQRIPGLTRKADRYAREPGIVATRWPSAIACGMSPHDHWRRT